MFHLRKRFNRVVQLDSASFCITIQFQIISNTVVMNVFFLFFFKTRNTFIFFPTEKRERERERETILYYKISNLIRRIEIQAVQTYHEHLILYTLVMLR